MENGRGVLRRKDAIMDAGISQATEDGAGRHHHRGNHRRIRKDQKHVGVKKMKKRLFYYIAVALNFLAVRIAKSRLTQEQFDKMNGGKR